MRTLACYALHQLECRSGAHGLIYPTEMKGTQENVKAMASEMSGDAVRVGAVRGVSLCSSTIAGFPGTGFHPPGANPEP